MQCIPFQVSFYWLWLIVECRLSACKLLVGYMKLQLFVRDIDLDLIAVFNEGNRTASSSFWGNMADEAAVVGAGEAAIGKIC